MSQGPEAERSGQVEGTHSAARLDQVLQGEEWLLAFWELS